MNIIFSSKAWDEYLYWQKTDKKILKRINIIIKDTILFNILNLYYYNNRLFNYERLLVVIPLGIFRLCI